jgi:hypothetical protein
LLNGRPNPTLYEINTLPWLNKLREAYGADLTLSKVPYEEWRKFKDLGFDYVWLMGVWKRSRRSAEIARGVEVLKAHYNFALPGWRPEDVVGSPYAVQSYEVDPMLGTSEDLKAVKKVLNELGMGLILDYVPNHLAVDHPWVFEHPDYFVQADAEEFRREPSNYLKVDLESGTVYIAHGRDPYFPPWTDTVQFNIFNKEARDALIKTLRSISEYCDGVRCDVAMLLLNDVFERTWGHLLRKRGWEAKEEFWSEAIREIKKVKPDFTMIAEVYWGLEDRMLNLGFDYAYDKNLYDNLLNEQIDNIKRMLSTDQIKQSRYVRFTENHDELRAVTAFGRERSMAASLITYTLPSMRLFHQGQLEGRKIRAPLQLRRVTDEAVDGEIHEFYTTLLTALKSDTLHYGEWRPVRVDGAQTVFSWIWELGIKRAFISVNYSSREALCVIVLDRWLLKDVINARVSWKRGIQIDDVDTRGHLKVRLEPYALWLTLA